MEARSMAEMTKKERVRATLASQPADRAPASLWGHDFLREWSAEDLVAATMDAYRANDWDFIKFNPRATYFAEAWGNTYDRPTDQRQPALISAVVRDAAALASIKPVDPAGGPFSDHRRALRLLVGDVSGSVDVLHTIFSPLAVTAQLCGADPMFRDFASSKPDAAHAAIAAVTETLTAYARASIAAGAAGIFFAPLRWASRDTCDEAFYQTFGRPYDLEVLAAVSSAEFNVLHVCRNNNMLESLLDYPVAAFNWADRGEGNPSLRDIRAQTSKAIMGGIDNAHLHAMSPDEVRAQGRDALSVGRGLFLTAGCAIRPDTPAANRTAVAEAVRAYGTAG
jgi:uroporphyrinogen decarboxylase